MSKTTLVGLIAAAAVVWGASSARGQQVREEWVARYDAGVGNSEYGSSIAVDVSGNVYVAGRSPGEAGWDYLTIKYDPGGNELWVARYNGPGNSRDYAWSLAVDALQNVYVTGQSDGDGTGFDFATIKYDAEGNEIWVARYDGGADGDDAARALALDGQGNVYVTGGSWGGDSASDFATIRYDSAGRQVWVARYNGTAKTGYDTPKALAVDALGHVYVTGASYAGRNHFDIDYVTIKYDARGNALWVATYNSPTNDTDDATAIALDDSGNVYVTGASRNREYQYATIKYDPAGRALWEARYIGPQGEGGDRPSALILDAFGHVYVTGRSANIAAWPDYATVKYDAATGEPSQTWADVGFGRGVRRFNGSENSADEARAMAVDGCGDVYVTGYSYSDPTGADFATIKYGASGEMLWLAVYDGPGHKGDSTYAVVVDDRGSVYVTGGSSGVQSYWDCATIKYSQGSECTADEKIRGKCKRRAGANAVRAVAVRGVPGDTVSLCLDDQDCIRKTLDKRGKAKTKWMDVRPGGPHTISAQWDCGACERKGVDCPNP